MVSRVTIKDKLISRRQKDVFDVILRKKDNGQLYPTVKILSFVTDENETEFVISTRSRKRGKEKICTEQNLIEVLEIMLRLFEIKPENVIITSIINAMPCNECNGILKNNIGKKFREWRMSCEEETFTDFLKKCHQHHHLNWFYKNFI